MLISELSRKSGFSKDTIRFYEKTGLIELNGNHRRENNYKDYPEAVLKRLLAIKKIKDYGFTLEETKYMMILFEEGVLEPERGKKYLEKKISLIDKKMEELKSIKQRLQDLLNTDKENCVLHKILMELN